MCQRFRIFMDMDLVMNHLRNSVKRLSGEWIKRNSNYEHDACLDLGFKSETKRYWDCEFNGTYIEIKKGKSIWLDEVRYSEIFLSDEMDNPDCRIDTITMFLIPSKCKEFIEKILLVDTKRIISFMKIDREWGSNLLERRKKTTRSLNCQQSMTVRDVESIANHIIYLQK